MAAAGEIEYKKIKNYDGAEIASTFFEYFYKNWLLNPMIFLEEQIIKHYSKINYNGNEFSGDDFVKLLIELASNGLEFANCKYQMIDSGSRQIYILVTGLYKIDNNINNFSQSFMISFCGEKKDRKWTLVNSILMW